MWPQVDSDGCLKEQIDTNKQQELGCSRSLRRTADYRSGLVGEVRFWGCKKGTARRANDNVEMGWIKTE